MMRCSAACCRAIDPLVHSKGTNEVTYRSVNCVTTLLMASPALAQTNDQAVSEGAGVIAWILVGLIGGYLASRMVNKTGEGVVRDIILGIIGGIVGGIISTYLAAMALPDSTFGDPGRVHRRRRGAGYLPCDVSAAASLNYDAPDRAVNCP